MRDRLWGMAGFGVLVAVLCVSVWSSAGSPEPPGPPGSTMHTLTEIYENIESMKGLVTPQTLSDETVEVRRGYYEATTLDAVDPDLTAGNIKSGVTIFGIEGNHEGEIIHPDISKVPKTGQTASYRTGDDGDLQKGAAWPDPRFTDHDDGTVTDNLTGQMWVKAPHSLDGNSAPQTWSDVIDFCNDLAHAGFFDWRLPNVRESQSLIDYGRFDPALPFGHLFTGIQSSQYWSSTTSEDNSDYAWYVYLGNGNVTNHVKTFSNHVWPVRAGE